MLASRKPRCYGGCSSQETWDAVEKHWLGQMNPLTARSGWLWPTVYAFAKTPAEARLPGDDMLNMGPEASREIALGFAVKSLTCYHLPRWQPAVEKRKTAFIKCHSEALSRQATEIQTPLPGSMLHTICNFHLPSTTICVNFTLRSSQRLRVARSVWCARHFPGEGQTAFHSFLT